MEKFLKTTTSICAGLIILLFIEGMFTLGQAFDFEQYNWFGWLVQAIFVILTISFSAWLSIKEDNESKKI
jgi:hypothetical protein